MRFYDSDGNEIDVQAQDEMYETIMPKDGTDDIVPNYYCSRCNSNSGNTESFSL